MQTRDVLSPVFCSDATTATLLQLLSDVNNACSRLIGWGRHSQRCAMQASVIWTCLHVAPGYQSLSDWSWLRRCTSLAFPMALCTRSACAQHVQQACKRRSNIKAKLDAVNPKGDVSFPCQMLMSISSFAHSQVVCYGQPASIANAVCARTSPLH